jgi:hypothetical protein
MDGWMDAITAAWLVTLDLSLDIDVCSFVGWLFFTLACSLL